MIWLHLASCVIWMSLAAAGVVRLAEFPFGEIVASVCHLNLCSYGRKAGYVWVAVPLAVWSLWVFLSGMTGGVTLIKSFNLIHSVLAFVAVCGVFIWLRERGEQAEQSPPD